MTVLQWYVYTQLILQLCGSSGPTGYRGTETPFLHDHITCWERRRAHRKVLCRQVGDPERVQEAPALRGQLRVTSVALGRLSHANTAHSKQALL